MQGITGRDDSDLIFMADDFDTLDAQLEDLVNALKAVSAFTWIDINNYDVLNAMK